MAHDPAEIENYLKGARCLATGGKLADVAAGNGAPADVLSRLREFDRKQFDDPGGVA